MELFQASWFAFEKPEAPSGVGTGPRSQGVTSVTPQTPGQHRAAAADPTGGGE